MSAEKRYLCLDFGASSGRAILGKYNGETLALEEVHRFSNDPVEVCGTLYWDVLRLFYEIKQALLKTKAYGALESIGVDTWGVDFGLLDRDGYLLENPVHYRDARTAGTLEQAFQKLPREEFYQITGNQFMEINTAFQLFALQAQRPQVLENAETLLLMPDLFNYLLTGERKAEYSIATTTQLLDARRRVWSDRVLSALGIPRRLFPEVIPTATPVGRLRTALCEELGLPPTRVTAVAGHDTQCAMASVPAETEDFLFLSCGTWSLLGTELAAPLISDEAYRCNVTNEGGYGGKASFLKNIIGLWLIQETRRQWQREGESISFAEMESLAKRAKPFQSFIDPDDARFAPPGDIPTRIRAYCAETGQPVPESKAEVLRCIYDSLAMKYRYAIGQIERCTQKKYDTLYIVGGGVKDRLLCALTADVCRKTVSAGPVEATAYGNLLLQMLADGTIEDLQAARALVRRCEHPQIFAPHLSDDTETAYPRFLKGTGLC